MHVVTWVAPGQGISSAGVTFKRLRTLCTLAVLWSWSRRLLCWRSHCPSVRTLRTQSSATAMSTSNSAHHLTNCNMVESVWSSGNWSQPKWLQLLLAAQRFHGSQSILRTDLVLKRWNYLLPCIFLAICSRIRPKDIGSANVQAITYRTNICLHSMALPVPTQLNALRGPAIEGKKLKSMKKFEMIKQALGFCLKRLGNFGKL